MGWRKRRILTKDKDVPKHFISVIIPFRNEEGHLETLLDVLTDQSYPHESFEIILINDHSNDGSVEVIESFKEKSALQIILLNATESGKKKALEVGINHAKGDIILQTDADCQMQEGWIESMASAFQGSAQLVLGPVNMIAASGFWSAFAALDFMSLQASGASLTLLGKPIMGSAANMAYTKELWEQAKNEGSSRDSGDDVFLIQAANSLGARVEFNTDSKSIVLTEAPASFTEMLDQRSRWGAKTPSYQLVLAKSIALLVAFYSIWCVVLLGYGIFSKPMLQLFIFTIGVKAVLDYYFLKSYSKATGQQGLMKIFPSAALIYPFYIVITLIAMIFGKQKWKGRTIR